MTKYTQSSDVITADTDLSASKAQTNTTDIPDSTRAKFRYWRIRIMYSMMVGYAGFYLVRKNFTMAIPALQDEFGYTKTQLGLILTIFSIVYGVGKTLNGFLSDKANARYFMATGLLCASICSVLIGLSSGLLFFGIFYTMNAWFQSMGWPPCARLLTHWYTPKELGTKWGIWNCSHQIGGAFILILAGYLIENYGWREAFYVPAVIAAGISLFLFNRLRDTPHSLGLPSPEAYKGHKKPKHGLNTEDDDDDDRNLTFKEIFFEKLLYNKLLWYVCIGNFFLYVVRIGVFDWAPTFLKEVKGSSLAMAGWQTAAFEIAGAFGGIFAGWASDHVFHGRRAPVSFLYMLALLFVLLYFWKIPAGNQLLDALALFGIGFLVYGPQVLVGVAAADYASKKAVGAATGMTGTFGYMGAAVCGVGIGYTVDNWGWDGGFWFFIVAAVLGAFFFALTWWTHDKQLRQQKLLNAAP